MLDSLDELPPRTRKVCLRSLYETCGREALLPKSLQIPLCYKPEENPDYKGGLADVWKDQNAGRHVAAKALRVSKSSNLEQIRKVRSAQLAIFYDELIVTPTVVLQGGPSVEGTSPSKRAAAVKRYGDRKSASVRDGIGVDGKWERQRIPEGASRCRSTEACAFSFRVNIFIPVFTWSS